MFPENVPTRFPKAFPSFGPSCVATSFGVALSVFAVRWLLQKASLGFASLPLWPAPWQPPADHDHHRQPSVPILLPSFAPAHSCQRPFSHRIWSTFAARVAHNKAAIISKFGHTHPSRLACAHSLTRFSSVAFFLHFFPPYYSLKMSRT